MGLDFLDLPTGVVERLAMVRLDAPIAELVNLEDQSVLFNANTLNEQKEVVEILSKKIDS